jgi:RIO-like serine/threonine protein kinase
MLECSDDKETCDANTEKLKMMTTLGDEQMERALKSLEDLGLIHKLGYKFDIDKLRALTVRIK